MNTNFEKVINFNKTFGVKVHNTPQNNIFTNDPKLVKLRMDLIREEMNELEDAVKNHDMKETIDALADILYVVYGMGASIGVNLDKAFDIVHNSNMSKACKNKEIAQKTVEKYKMLYENGKSPYDSPNYRQCEENPELYVVYNQSTGKILKSIEYNQVDFTDFY